MEEYYSFFLFFIQSLYTKQYNISYQQYYPMQDSEQIFCSVHNFI